MEESDYDFGFRFADLEEGICCQDPRSFRIDAPDVTTLEDFEDADGMLALERESRIQAHQNRVQRELGKE